MICSALRLTAAEQRPQQARDGQDDVTMRDRLEHSLHYRLQRTVRLGDPLRINAQELLEVLINQSEERGLPRASRPVHPRTDLQSASTLRGCEENRRDRGYCPASSFFQPAT
jgi:hypothetical protein